jgi:hypothetical protein
MPAGESRLLRLDPMALPVRFTAHDAVADGRVRLVEIDRDHVLLSRSVRGMAIRVRVPVPAFRGVAARAVTVAGRGEIVLTLEHSDPALSVDLFAATDDTDVAAEWQLWASVLGMPLLTVDQAGAIHMPVAQLDAVRVGEPAPRRRRCNAIKSRRPKLPLRRKGGRVLEQPAVYREREIIARN